MPDAGWLADPTGRFQYRYWDGTQWSAAVSRQGSQETDALSVQPAPPGPASTAPPPPPAASPPDPAGVTRVTGGPAAPPPPAASPPPPASAPPAAFPSPGAVGASSGAPTIGVGEVVLGLGVIAIVVSIFLQWLDFSGSISGTQLTERFTASGVPVQVLVNYTTARHDPTFLVLLIPIAVVCLLGLVLRPARWLAVAGGALALAVAGMFSFQVHQAVHSTTALHGFGVFDFLGVGPYVCAAGAVLAVIGGALPAGRRSTA